MKHATQLALALSLLLLAGCATAPKTAPDERPVSEPSAEPSTPADSTPEPPATPPPVVPPPLPGGAMAVAAEDETRERAVRLQRLARGSDALPARDVGYYLDVLYAKMLKMLGADDPPQRKDGTLRIVLPPSVTFDHGSDQLAAGADRALDPLLAVLTDYSALLISIHGHTDATGPAEVNQRLSARRALTVARRLQEAGVSSDRLMVIGHGADQPIADNTTDAGRQLNRRVEILLQPIIAVAAGE